MARCGRAHVSVVAASSTDGHGWHTSHQPAARVPTSWCGRALSGRQRAHPVRLRRLESDAPGYSGTAAHGWNAGGVYVVAKSAAAASTAALPTSGAAQNRHRAYELRRRHARPGGARVTSSARSASSGTRRPAHRNIPPYPTVRRGVVQVPLLDRKRTSHPSGRPIVMAGVRPAQHRRGNFHPPPSAVPLFDRASRPPTCSPPPRATTRAPRPLEQDGGAHAKDAANVD